MGIFVNLNIFPERINPEAWRSAYLESLRLLQAWPAKILGLRKETVGSHERLTYSSNFEHHPDEWEKRHWKVEGDQESCQFGETFELYGDLNRYSRPAEVIERDQDPLLTNLETRCGAGRTIFDAKTQGLPYHYAVLAVAMLMEDAFPQAALASGDITLAQAIRAQQTIREVLGKEVALPIAVDGERLLQEYTRQVGMENGLQRFLNCYQGKSEGALRIAADCVDPSLLHRCYAIHLTQRPEPETLGFRRFCQSWMNATADVSALIDMASLHEAGPQVDPVKLSAALVGTWLTVPPGIFAFFPHPDENKVESPTIDDWLQDSMIRMAGLQGINTRAHVGVEALLAEFQKLFPAQFEEIRKTVIQEHGKLLDKLKQLDQQSADLVQGTMDGQTPDKQPSFNFNDLRNIESSASLSDEVANVLDGLAQALRTGIRRMQESAPEMATHGPEQIRAYIYRVSQQRHIALTERGWRWIDQETDANILLIVLFLISIQDNSMTFTDLREILLECPVVLAAVRDRMAKNWT
ncbi:MAG: hypothetical protein HQL87_13735 [Magnetococcales bacterium]|nr:hypothetical protein [Magnetococcales bacterium]